jgi:hypothetical protein
MTISGTWVPLALPTIGGGHRCQVCGGLARWTRWARVVTCDRGPIISHVYRCDAHAPGATAGRPPCGHRAGPCVICPRLDGADPLAWLHPSRPHRHAACPR